MKMNRVLFLFGTRPEAIKLAPVIRLCRQFPESLECVVGVTGQHREMLQQVLDYFEIKPDVHLDLMVPNQTLAGLTSRCIEGVDQMLERIQPDCVVAQGDTTTVMCAALASFYRKRTFLHVEAGLRTGDIHSPWPEELNRRIASLVTSLHCAPTERSRQNLLNEQIPANRIVVTGNTVIDALLWTVERERQRQDYWSERYAFLEDRRLVLITGHRRENFGSGFQQVCEAIRELAGSFPETEFLYPVHLNPNVQKPVYEMLSDLPNLHLQAPAPYPEFVWLMDRATLILSDSGGIQEEAPSLKKPLLVTRETTERPEAVDAGAVELVGTSRQRIVERVSLLLEDQTEYQRRQIPVNPYGDGNASERILELLLRESLHRDYLPAAPGLPTRGVTP